MFNEETMKELDKLMDNYVIAGYRYIGFNKFNVSGNNNPHFTIYFHQANFNFSSVGINILNIDGPTVISEANLNFSRELGFNPDENKFSTSAFDLFNISSKFTTDEFKKTVRISIKIPGNIPYELNAENSIYMREENPNQLNVIYCINKILSLRSTILF